ncbi:MAG: hypothetical protein QMC70_08660 [Bacteroidia bacterium]|tara:strand:+ start:5028 stop:5276 length:249 start_codon:yes stop_codon:yes gene_type:complete
MRIVLMSCRQAALLDSKASFRTLNPIEAVKLKMHLKMCSNCQDFYKDSALIDEAIEKITQQREKQQMELSDTQRNKILDALK